MQKTVLVTLLLCAFYLCGYTQPVIRVESNSGILNIDAAHGQAIINKGLPIMNSAITFTGNFSPLIANMPGWAGSDTIHY